MTKRNVRMFCAVVTSVVNFIPNILSYSEVRSVFSADERARQTQKTIASLREKIPGVHIVLVEMGTEERLPFGLDTLADDYLYLGGRWPVRWACDSRHKGLGEIMGLIAARKLLQDRADFYFKISGRYFLTEDFDLASWNHDKIVVRKWGKRNQDISTRLYGLSRRFFGVWQSSLWKSAPFMLQKRAIEHIMPKFLPDEAMFDIKTLGVSGLAAHSGEHLTE